MYICLTSHNKFPYSDNLSYCSICRPICCIGSRPFFKSDFEECTVKNCITEDWKVGKALSHGEDPIEAVEEITHKKLLHIEGVVSSHSWFMQGKMPGVNACSILLIYSNMSVCISFVT